MSNLNTNETLYDFIQQTNNYLGSLSNNGTVNTASFNSLSNAASQLAGKIQSNASDITDLKTSATNVHIGFSNAFTSLSNELNKIDVNSSDISNAETFINRNGASINNVNNFANSNKSTISSLSGVDSSLANAQSMAANSANTAITNVSSSADKGIKSNADAVNSVNSATSNLSNMDNEINELQKYKNNQLNMTAQLLPPNLATITDYTVGGNGNFISQTGTADSNTNWINIEKGKHYCMSAKLLKGNNSYFATVKDGGLNKWSSLHGSWGSTGSVISAQFTAQYTGKFSIGINTNDPNTPNHLTNIVITQSDNPVSFQDAQRNKAILNILNPTVNASRS